MEQRRYRYFESVARLGSLRRSSEDLHVAISAISRTIALLEAEAGVALFERSARGMILTDAGNIYLRYARGALIDAERLRAELDDLKGLRRGHVRIASIEGPAGDIVAGALVGFRRRFPGISLSLRVAGADVVTNAVIAREVDIAVAANAPADPRLDVAARITDPLLAVTAPGYPLKGRRLRFADVARDHPMAIPDHTFAIRRQIDACAQQQRLVLAPVLVASSIAALRGFARAGGGVTLLPALAMQDDLRRGVLSGKKLSDRILQGATIELLVSTERVPPLPVQELLGHLKRALVARARGRGGAPPPAAKTGRAGMAGRRV